MLSWAFSDSFLVSAIASVGYAVGLLVPNLLSSPDMAPIGVAWSRYLIPIYLGLGLMAWEGFRRPNAATWVGRALVVVWGGLVVAHFADLVLGDEQLGLLTAGLVAMGVTMSVLILAGMVRQGGAAAAR